MHKVKIYVGENMKKLLLCLIVSINFIVVNTIFAKLPAPGEVDGVVAFGDSLTDIGNYKATPMSTCVLINVGEDAPVTNKKGGLTPGKLWINHLAEYYKVPISPGNCHNEDPKEPKLCQKPHHKPNGTVWAMSGAKTSTTANRNKYDYPLMEQVSDYIAKNKSTINAKKLYVIWAGSNDILVRILAEEEDPATVFVQALFSIQEAIHALATEGARQFLVIGVPDLSLTPVVNIEYPPMFWPERSKLYDHKDDVQKVSIKWNEKLFSKNAQEPGEAPLAGIIESGQYPGIKIYTWDVYSALQKIVQNPVKYQFADKIKDTWDLKVKNNNQTFYCAFNEYHPIGADKFIFHDLIHPSARTHKLLVDMLKDEAALFTV